MRSLNPKALAHSKCRFFRLSASMYRRIAAAILTTYLCSAQLNADCEPEFLLNPLSQNDEFLYSIDDPIDNPLDCIVEADGQSFALEPALETAALDEGSISPQPEESNQLFYPNLFQNDLFSPPPSTSKDILPVDSQMLQEKDIEPKEKVLPPTSNIKEEKAPSTLPEQTNKEQLPSLPQGQSHLEQKSSSVLYIYI